MAASEGFCFYLFLDSRFLCLYVCIVTDSSTVLHGITNLNYGKSPHLLLLSYIYNLKVNDSTITILLTWLPGHYNNTHIHTTDKNAKFALRSKIIPQFNLF